MEITTTTLLIIALAFVIGAALGWVLRRPHVLATTPPDLEREKTLVEARHEALMDDIKTHLQETEQALHQLADKQAMLKATLDGEAIDVVSEPLDPAELGPPRDYADSRGQLQ